MFSIYSPRPLEIRDNNKPIPTESRRRRHDMDSLPAELLSLVLLWNVRTSRCEKNTILPLRLVCKAFDEILKPYVFKTIQLEFSRFLRQRRGSNEAKDDEGKLVRGLHGHGSGLDGIWGNEEIWKLRMDREGLRRVGGYCEALYLDLMVVRDEGMFCDFFCRAWVENDAFTSYDILEALFGSSWCLLT